MDKKTYHDTRDVLDTASIKHYIKRTPDGVFLVCTQTPLLSHSVTRILQDLGWEQHRATEDGLEYKHQGEAVGK